VPLSNPAALYEACRRLSPVRPDYTSRPIEERFNWSSCLSADTFDRLYLVVFRSVRRTTADLDLLREHDDRAHDEALRAGGLLRYFKGEANERRECVSFCLWESREKARRAAGGALHWEAARTAAQTYESYTLERYDLTKVGGAKPNLLFRPLEEVFPGPDASAPAFRTAPEPPTMPGAGQQDDLIRPTS
jgi:hypothetical protein